MQKQLASLAVVFGTLAGLGLLASACASQPSDENTGTALGAADTPDGGAARGSVVISSVYAGGGRSSATFKNDYVELLNKTTKDIVLDGMSIQVSSSPTTALSQVVELTGTIKAQSYFLVAMGSGGSTGVALTPTPDQAAAADAAQLSSDGKSGIVALANGTTALNCGGLGGATCATRPVDLVGFGQATGFEGTKVAPPPDDNKHALVRGNDGCSDVDDNSKDFTSVTPPAPRNGDADTKNCIVPKDAGADSGPAPPVKDPDLGNETPFDAGSPKNTDAGASSGGGDDSGCSLAALGTGADGIFSPILGLALGALYLTRRRGRRSAR